MILVLRGNLVVGLISGPAQRLGPYFPLDRALIGGAQPIHGWWAPDALRYKKEEWGPQALDPRFAVLSTHSTKP
jgi:hypothetical protein